MRMLNNLIRLHKWRLDEKRQTLADLERLGDDLQTQLQKLKLAADDERALAAESDDVRFAYPAYAAAVRENRETLSASLVEVTERIEAAQDEMMVAFRELKRLEVSLETHQRRERAHAERREQLRLDEIAIEGHRRRQAGD